MSSRTTAPKLKDSCDTCAASKIRCDKQKPLCGRCERLGYPCFYSPARRTGYAQSRHTSNEAGSKTSNRGIRAGGERQDGEQGHNRLVKTNIPASSEPTSAPQSATNDQTSDSAYIQHHGLSVVGRDEQKSHSKGHRRNRTWPPQDGIDESDSRTTETSTGQNSCSEMDPPSSKSISDCSSVAMEIILQLELLKNSLSWPQEGSRPNHFEPSLFNNTTILRASESYDAVRTVVGSLRKLSTILVCPCFEKQDVGLLAAAACLSVLDMYSTIIRRSAREDADAPIPRALGDDLSCVLATDRAFANGQMFPTGMTHVGPSSGNNEAFQYFDRSGSSQATDEALRELPKVARILLQMMKRYQNGGPEKVLSELRKSLGQYLGVQLQALTTEAADFGGLNM